jgi:hypothetical protein
MKTQKSWIVSIEKSPFSLSRTQYVSLNVIQRESPKYEFSEMELTTNEGYATEFLHYKQASAIRNKLCKNGLIVTIRAMQYDSNDNLIKETRLV